MRRYKVNNLCINNIQKRALSDEMAATTYVGSNYNKYKYNFL